MKIKANALFNLERYEEAIEYYDKALAIDPNNAKAWYAKGYTLGKLGKYNEAIQAYDRVI